jgi:hypothetical protein
MADGGGPEPRLTAHTRWSAAFDSERRRAVCKTVGSAYVGSNPTPATTSVNGPLAGMYRLCGPFPSCYAVYRHVSLCVDALRFPRTYSGRRAGRSRGRCNRRLSTDGHGRAALTVFPGLDVNGGAGRAFPARPPVARVFSRGKCGRDRTGDRGTPFARRAIQAGCRLSGPRRYPVGLEYSNTRM